MKHSYESYVEWCRDIGDDPAPSNSFRFLVTEIEQKWLILDAMHRQIRDDPDAETVSSEHILGVLSDNAFPPSLEGHIEILCERGLVEYQRPDPAKPAP